MDAELEIAFHAENVASRDSGQYRMELRHASLEKDAAHTPIAACVVIPMADLLASDLERTEYAQRLTAAVFADAALRQAYQAYRAASSGEHDRLRIRLFIGPTAPELHALRWELLSDPASNEPLSTSHGVTFSRFLASPLGHRFRTMAPASLRALVVAASPSDSDQWQLASFDARAEARAVAEALRGWSVSRLGDDAAATVDALKDTLAPGADVLIIVAHGVIRAGGAALFLQREDGRAERVPVERLVEILAALPEAPRLVVLSSCNSANDDQDGAFARALGPMLVARGVPGVIAMQGRWSFAAASAFLPALTESLGRDGLVDVAVQAGRRAASDTEGFWRPALFTCLVSGRLWRSTAQTEDASFGRWPAILGHVAEDRCTPILGTGVLEGVTGPLSTLAQEWARRWMFPGSTHEVEDLADVAQFIATWTDYPTLHSTFESALVERLSARPAASGSAAPTLTSLLAAIGAAGRKDPDDPYRVLSDLGLSLYITTNPDDLLFDALVERGRRPERDYCRWRETELPEGIFAREPEYRPTPDRPLVYHLFGHLADRGSVVLTSDDYLEYMFAVAATPERIPAVVRRALSRSSLLFLGFSLHDPDFRALFRLILGQPGGKAGRLSYSHVAVQLDPEEWRSASAPRARKYLERYFDQAKIGIYWGDLRTFVRELREHRAPSP